MKVPELTKAQKLAIKRTLQLVIMIAALISGLLVPLVEFGFITNERVKWIVYSVLVFSVIGTFAPRILEKIPPRAKARDLRGAIITSLDTFCTTFTYLHPAKY